MEYTREYLESKIKSCNKNIEWCQNATKIDPKSTDYWFYMAKHYVEKKQYYVEKLKELDNKLSKDEISTNPQQ